MPGMEECSATLASKQTRPCLRLHSRRCLGLLERTAEVDLPPPLCLPLHALGCGAGWLVSAAAAARVRTSSALRSSDAPARTPLRIWLRLRRRPDLAKPASPICFPWPWPSGALRRSAACRWQRWSSRPPTTTCPHPSASLAAPRRPAGPRRLQRHRCRIRRRVQAADRRAARAAWARAAAYAAWRVDRGWQRARLPAG